MLTCYCMILFRISMTKFVWWCLVVVVDIWKGVLNNMSKNLYFCHEMMFDDVKVVLLSLYVLGMFKVDSFKDLYDESWCFYWVLSLNPKQRVIFWVSSLKRAPMNLAASLCVLVFLPRKRLVRLASSSEL
jgi:hypothetical protein